MDRRRSAIFPFQTGNTLGKSDPKNQNCKFKLKFVTRTHSNMEFNGDVHFFRFLPEIRFFGKFGSKVQNCFKVKFGTLADSKYAKLIGDVHFFCFRLELSFLSKFSPKNQNCQFKLSTQTSQNMQNLTVMFMKNIMVTFTFFLFLTGNTLYGQIWLSKLSVQPEIWYLD